MLNNSNNYFIKYKKYKNKYLQLKNKTEKINDDIPDEEQILKLLYEQSTFSIINTLNKLSNKEKTKNLIGNGFISNNSKDIFIEYIDKGKIDFLVNPNTSSFGILLKIKIDNIEEISDNLLFYNINIDRIIKKNFKIDEICVKLILTSDIQYRYILDKKIKKYTETIEQTISDIEMQNIVARTTNGYFESSAPFVLHADFFEKNNAGQFLDLLINKNQSNNQLIKILDEIKEIITKYNYGLTVIVMDLIKDIYNEPITYSYLEIASSMYELMRTILNSRIIPIDIHYGNFIRVKDPNYLQDYPNFIRYYLIDFYPGEIIDNNLYDIIYQNFKKKKYIDFFINIKNYYYEKNHNNKYKNLLYFFSILDKETLDLSYLEQHIKFIVNKRNAKTTKLLLDKNFLNIVEKNNLLNLEYTYHLVKSTINNDNLFFRKILESSNLIDFDHKKVLNRIKILFKKIENKLPKNIYKSLEFIMEPDIDLIKNKNSIPIYNKSQIGEPENNELQIVEAKDNYKLFKLYYFFYILLILIEVLVDIFNLST